MDCLETKAKITQLIGTDLRPLADQLRVTVKKEDGKINKGWAGHVIERYLELPLNCAQITKVFWRC